MFAPQEAAIPEPIRASLRGIGQIMFQDNAITGILFLIGIALCSPLMAGGLLAGAILGTATAKVLKFNSDEWTAGIWGFNPALVGIATLFFFTPGMTSLLLLCVGCILATVLTRLMREYVPFPTYTAPFIVTTWGVFFLGKSINVAMSNPDTAPLLPNLPVPFFLESTAHGIGQVMFQGSLWTGLLFFIGLWISNQRHAVWVLTASFIGMLVASYHVDASLRTLDPERLIERDQFDNIKLGLYGYNATLAAVALYLRRPTLIWPLFGVLLTVPLTELLPRLGLPALTAPFVLATWIVLGLGWIEEKYLATKAK